MESGKKALFYGFTQDQSIRFAKSFSEPALFINTEKVVGEINRPNQKFFHKNEIELPDTETFNKLHKELIAFYKTEGKPLPYERLSDFNLNPDAILSIVDLFTRVNSTFTRDSIMYFRRSLNLAVYLFEGMKVGFILLRTSPQSHFGLLLNELAKHFGVDVIAGDQHIGVVRWSLRDRNLREFDSGLKNNLSEDYISNLVSEATKKEKLAVVKDRDKIRSISVDQAKNSTSLLIAQLINLLKNYFYISLKIFRFSYYMMREFFKLTPEFSLGGKRRIRVYWFHLIKDLFKTYYIHCIYLIISFKSWKKFCKNENSKYHLLLTNYQPEASTNPDTFLYHDYRNTIDTLRAKNKENLPIIYKEHPTIIFRHLDYRLRGAYYRSWNYYKDIERRGVYFAPIEIDTDEMIDLSTLSTAITSTAFVGKFLNSGKSGLDPNKYTIMSDQWYGGFKGINSINSTINNTESLQKKSVSTKEELSEFLRKGFFTEGSDYWEVSTVDQLIPLIKPFLKA